jgi:predicted RNA polymerase sigma factor
MLEEPEPLGLLALIPLHLARCRCRMERRGQLLLLQHQNRSAWDSAAIKDAVELIEPATVLRKPGH